MNRTDRLYALTEELRAAGASGRTAAQLAERFEVATRTVKRDLSALQQAGLPIWSTGGPGGGYRLDATASLPPLTFTSAEATAVAVAVAAQPGLPFGPDGRSALSKVLTAMTEDQRAVADDLAGRVWVRRDEDERPAVARTLDEAVRRHVVVVIDYVDREGAASARRPVEPMAFARTRGRWYLLAWCRRRRGGRWFRLDRIVAAHVTSEVADPRDVVATFGEPPPDARPVRLA